MVDNGRVRHTSWCQTPNPMVPFTERRYRARNLSTEGQLLRTHGIEDELVPGRCGWMVLHWRTARPTPRLALLAGSIKPQAPPSARSRKTVAAGLADAGRFDDSGAVTISFFLLCLDDAAAPFQCDHGAECARLGVLVMPDWGSCGKLKSSQLAIVN